MRHGDDRVRIALADLLRSSGSRSSLMIKGLSHFTDHFAGNAEDFVVIGGVSCLERESEGACVEGAAHREDQSSEV